jgi:hypothetical protein
LTRFIYQGGDAVVRSRKSVAAAALLFATVLAAGASADSKIELGTLTCSGGEGVGLILGSKKSYTCTFAYADGRPPESYQATVTKIGLDIGVTGKTVMVWTVLAATQALDSRPLAGSYAGAVADASVGIGAGAKVLVGGSKQSITLQPVSVQGQTGVNVAVGVAEMKLR